MKSNSYYIKAICLFFSISFFVAGIVAAIYLDCWNDILPGLFNIMTLPAPLVTDYFQLGNLASAFFNAGACGLACTAIMFYYKCNCQPSFLAGYFLVTAHCFYGLSFLNMWPPMIGIYIFTKVKKISFSDNFSMAMFSTAFGPFITELLFRYHTGSYFNLYVMQISGLGFFYAIAFTFFLGFAIPAMLPGALHLHKGYNLFNGGLAFGLLGLFLYSFMYKSFDTEPPKPFVHGNTIYTAHGYSYQTFIVTFYVIVFLLILITGWYLNGKSLKGYRALLQSDGHNVNFFDQYGAPLVLINIGLYGLMMLTYFFVVIVLTEGDGFTGPTTGIILASITFVAQGQHPKNVWPVLMGFVTLWFVGQTIGHILGFDPQWTLSTQAYMNGAAFATGLCPITGHYGKRFGILAGVMCAIMCTSTSALHGGFVLYNGGLTAGITALILIPFLEYYWEDRKKNTKQ